MLDTMFDLFKLLNQQYPDSDLTSEFITYSGNEYAVCAMVKIGDRTLATGMAAASTIEAAEDRAKVRAIESLGIRHQPQSEKSSLPRNNDSVSPESHPVSSPSAEPALATLKPPRLRKRPTSPEHQIETSVNNAVPLTPNSTANVTEIYSEEWPELNMHQEESPASSPTNHANTPNPETKTQGAAENQPTEHSSIYEPSQTEVETELGNVNLVDAIAKTSVEMHRLGWDTHQGRQHLQATYNKRSRGELTDEELLDFLQFLEKQPNP